MFKITDYILVTPNAQDPLTLEEVKSYLKIDDDFYDSQLTLLIKTVTELAEKITGRDLLNKTYKGFLDCFPCDSLQIRKSKLQSITSIQYYKDGILTTFDSANYYFTENNNFSTINLVDGQSWPNDIDTRKQAVIITFVAGYGDSPCDIPATLKQAMLSNITSLFENSGDCASEVNKQAKSLYYPYILPTKLLLVI